MGLEGHTNKKKINKKKKKKKNLFLNRLTDLAEIFFDGSFLQMVRSLQIWNWLDHFENLALVNPSSGPFWELFYIISHGKILLFNQKCVKVCVINIKYQTQ